LRSLVILAVLIGTASNDGRPLWVDEAQAFAGNGRLRADLFRPEQIDLVDDYFRAVERDVHPAVPGRPCRMEMGAPIFENEPPRARTFDAMVSRSLTILTGRVTGLQQGFYRGSPGTLLRVAVAERLKDFGRLASSAEIHVFLSAARMQTTRGLLCVDDGVSVPMPAVGDRIAVFSESMPQDDRHELLPIDARMGLFVERSGKLALPRSMASTMAATPSTLSALVDLVRENPGVSDLVEPPGVSPPPLR